MQGAPLHTWPSHTKGHLLQLKARKLHPAFLQIYSISPTNEAHGFATPTVR